MGIGADVMLLMNTIGYTFNDIHILETALTHSSYSNEMKKRGYRIDSNESLEFLGDAVLELIVSEHLYPLYKKDGEGVLTRLRQILVCESTLARVARRINLSEFLNIGTGEENTGLRNQNKILADATEALIAAIYIDDGAFGGKRYKSVILKLLKEEIDAAIETGSHDYKTMLQQLVEKNTGSVLVYNYEESGPQHKKTFVATAFINNNKVGVGVGSSKRGAEQAAAKSALKLFGIVD